MSIEDLMSEFRYLVKKHIDSQRVYEENIDHLDEFIYTDEVKKGQIIEDPITGQKGVIIAYARRTYQV
jgi:hypothetical protein